MASPHKARRTSTSLFELLSVGLAVVALPCALAAGQADGTEAAANATAKLPQIYERALDEWVFGAGTTPAQARSRLGALLRERVEVIDRCCRMTDAHKQKLQLAGQRDIDRFFERVAETKRTYVAADADLKAFDGLTNELNKLNRSIDAGLPEEDVAPAKSKRVLLIRAIEGQESRLAAVVRQKARLALSAPDKVDAPAREAQLLQQQLRFGLCDETTLFSKFLGRLLTAEQAEQCRPLEQFFRAGGVIRIRRLGDDEMLEARLSSRSAPDDAIATLRQLPATLPDLRSLALENVSVSPAGLAALKALTRLETLDLSGTPLDDAGLEQLASLERLETLKLNRTPVTDAGLAVLKRFKRLRRLGLDNTRVTDAGLAHLNELAALESLDLDGSQVTDGGLAHLKGLSKLTQIGLRKTRVTEAGVAELWRALPKLTVRR